MGVVLVLGALGLIVPTLLAWSWRRQLAAPGTLRKKAVTALMQAHEERGQLLAAIALQLGVDLAGLSDDQVCRRIRDAIARDAADRAEASDALRAILFLAIGAEVPALSDPPPDAVVRQVMATWCTQRPCA